MPHSLDTKVSKQQEFVLRNYEQIVSTLVDQAKDGNIRAAELIERYMIEPVRKRIDAKRRERDKKKASLPPALSNALSQFSVAVAVRIEPNLPASLPAQPQLTDSISITAEACPVSDPTLVEDGGVREAAAKAGGMSAGAYVHPDFPPVENPILTSSAQKAQPDIRKCAGCGKSLAGYNGHAKYCIEPDGGCRRVVKAKQMAKARDKARGKL